MADVPVIVRDLLAEAALLGLLGAVFGVPLGVLMGRAAIGVLPPLLIQSFDARRRLLPAQLCDSYLPPPT